MNGHYTTEYPPGAVEMRRAVLDVLEVSDIFNDTDAIAVILRPGEWPSISAQNGDGREVTMPGGRVVAKIEIRNK